MYYSKFIYKIISYKFHNLGLNSDDFFKNIIDYFSDKINTSIINKSLNEVENKNSNINEGLLKNKVRRNSLVKWRNSLCQILQETTPFTEK